MDTLHWPLQVLSRAVHFKNLTGASAHVGLSQPQLSRLISQIEKEYDVTLLDRSAKRKSAWTTAAFRLAEIYAQNSRKLQSSIEEALVGQVPSHVHIGTLEGMSHLALKLAHALLTGTKVTEVELDVFDQNELEEKFVTSGVDLILTSRTPGKQKFKHVIEVGYQSLDRVESNNDFTLMSAYEYGRTKKKPENKILISNSLSVRRQWLADYGGLATVPSSVQKQKNRELTPVLILGSELFNETLWAVVEAAATRI